MCQIDAYIYDFDENRRLLIQTPIEFELWNDRYVIGEGGWKKY